MKENENETGLQFLTCPFLYFLKRQSNISINIKFWLIQVKKGEIGDKIL